MGESSKSTYHSLVITASRPETEIWLGDDQGHFVQKAVGELRTSLIPGDYIVEFGLGTQTYPVALSAPARHTQARLEGGPHCRRPTPPLPDQGP